MAATLVAGDGDVVVVSGALNDSLSPSRGAAVKGGAPILFNAVNAFYFLALSLFFFFYDLFFFFLFVHVAQLSIALGHHNLPHVRVWKGATDVGGESVCVTPTSVFVLLAAVSSRQSFFYTRVKRFLGRRCKKKKKKKKEIFCKVAFQQPVTPSLNLEHLGPKNMLGSCRCGGLFVVELRGEKSPWMQIRFINDWTIVWAHFVGIKL